MMSPIGIRSSRPAVAAMRRLVQPAVVAAAGTWLLVSTASRIVFFIAPPRVPGTRVWPRGEDGLGPKVLTGRADSPGNPVLRCGGARQPVASESAGPQA